MAAAGPGTAAAAPSCPGQAAPPPPAAREEVVPGAVPPPPLPVPPDPVGGPLLGACGDVLPPGAPPPPAVTAAGWVVADPDTGAVLAAHDPHGRQRPASTLKILTTLVVLQRLGLDTPVAATAEDTRIDGSKAGIGPGGSYTVRQLLTGLLLNSGNDTANALARALGGVPTTLAAMSETAARLGALDTRPATPSGLDGPGTSCSAYDLALFFRAALRDPTFTELIGTRQADFPGYPGRPGFRISSDNPLLRSYPGAIGGKTGYTDAARHTFVGAAQRGGRRLVVAMVRGEQRPVAMWKQAAALLDYGFALPVSAPRVGMLVDPAPRSFGAAPTTPPAAVVVQQPLLVTGGAPVVSVADGLLAGMVALAVAGGLVALIQRRARS
nr:D-alanyl-D-alanine carboxypeptidase family protein [Pseudonocardia acidicola]